ncbi:lipase family protein [Clostridium cellulovorans]|uniref:Lipase class 3 n=1 Tax=Clostridium cellulovorans (strain ATCC 35296 / DSM 3052 / OCM 3 / 743B) TaxID=573061 RepID=D9SWL0_CLOC7|nr:lipase family protein [Clostridium cellulovorans]ADL53292.1 lipase class 3 [Clostridium cellulovorans 743B]
MNRKEGSIKQKVALMMAMLLVSTSINLQSVQAVGKKKNLQERIFSDSGKENLDFKKPMTPKQYEILSLRNRRNQGNLESAPEKYKLIKVGEHSSTVDEKKDSDKDGLEDSLEKYFGTDVQRDDTDEDGLSDYIEIILKLNPLSKDTDGNSIEDGLEDADHDGLSNLEEKNIGTDCSEKDTDGDKLLDGEELKVNQTSPLLEDTDGDSLTDKDEILLNLNPCKASSDEVTHDSKRRVQQNLSDKRIADSLKNSSNLFVPFLSGATSRVIDENVFLDKYNNDVLGKNPAVISEPIQVKTLLNEGDQLLLRFDYRNFLNSHDESATDKLTICQFKNDEFIPLETNNDRSNRTLKANISGEGIYFVLDIGSFLNGMGIDTMSGKNSYEKTHSSLAEKLNTNIVVRSENDKTMVLLNDYQYVKLDDKVSEASNIDSDGDGVSDYKELGKKTVKDLKPFVNTLLKKEGISEDQYTGKTTVAVYQAVSNPTVADSDYDGRDDSNDPNPGSNSFSGMLSTDYANSNVSYIMDYRDFFSSNTSYNTDIGTISSLYSSIIYHGSTYSGMNMKEFMESNGMYDVTCYDFTSTYSDSDVSEAYIGHRKVSYSGQTKEIIAIVVRGTNGTIKEWSSNFDVGTTDQYYRYADWMVVNNHKGFDVAATRILRCLQQYESLGYIDTSVQGVYWVMGHSRGAGIANIIGARLIDKSKYVYAYTFAAPNTTTASNASNYVGIYNILNTDDFVPYLPMAPWGFKHYGKSVSISIADNYESEWESLTKCTNEFGVIDYNNDAIGMNDTLEALSAIVNNRNQCYLYTCDCHGDDSLDNITIRNYGTSKNSREEAIAKIPANALPYCKITRYTGTLFIGWDFEVCQQPEYFMQVLAAFMGNSISATRFAVELNIADRYESAKTAIIRSGLGGLAHPHYPESYYLLSKHVYASSF